MNTLDNYFMFMNYKSKSLNVFIIIIHIVFINKFYIQKYKEKLKTSLYQAKGSPTRWGFAQRLLKLKYLVIFNF